MIDRCLHDRYRLTGLLGRGGMANVYRAVDLVLERAVAVKILGEASEADARRLVREGHALSRLAHPGIVRLFDAGTVDGVPFLVLELVEGHSLARILTEGPLGEQAARRLGAELADALAHAHAQGIVHRDMKPSNVLVEPDGSARLADFGIAHLADATTTRMTGVMLGTAAYLAPEQVAGEVVGPPADVYALGLVLLEALTGERGYVGPPAEAALARLGRDPHVPAELPREWPALLRAMTAREPAERPTAAAVARWLSAGVFAAPESLGGRPPMPRPHLTARVALLLTVALLLSGTQLLAAGEPEAPTAVSASEVATEERSATSGSNARPTPSSSSSPTPAPRAPRAAGDGPVPADAANSVQSGPPPHARAHDTPPGKALSPSGGRGGPPDDARAAGKGRGGGGGGRG